jgi:hypothetical protein
MFGEQEIVHVPLTKGIFLSRFGNLENQVIVQNIRPKDKIMLADVIIQRFVYAVGYDKDFIIAKQLHTDLSTQTPQKSSGFISYHILDTRGETKIYTFHNQDEFNSQRKIVGVPDSLSFFLQFETSEQKN